MAGRQNRALPGRPRFSELVALGGDGVGSVRLCCGRLAHATLADVPSYCNVKVQGACVFRRDLSIRSSVFCAPNPAPDEHLVRGRRAGSASGDLATGSSAAECSECGDCWLQPLISGSRAAAVPIAEIRRRTATGRVRPLGLGSRMTALFTARAYVRRTRRRSTRTRTAY